MVQHVCDMSQYRCDHMSLYVGGVICFCMVVIIWCDIVEHGGDHMV